MRLALECLAEKLKPLIKISMFSLVMCKIAILLGFIKDDVCFWGWGGQSEIFPNGQCSVQKRSS